MAGERVIRISDLFWYIISKWKLVILAVIIGALLCGGYRYAASGKKQPANTASKTAAASDGLASYDHQAANLFFRYLSLSEKQLEHLRTAEFMKIDPYHADTGNAVFAVTCEDPGNTDIVLAAYESCLQQAEAQYGELFSGSVEKGFGSYYTEVDNGKNTILEQNDVKTGVIMIRIFGLDEDLCKERIGEISEMVRSVHEEMKDRIPAHGLIQVSEYTSQINSPELLMLQKEAADTMYQMTNYMNNIQKSFSPDATDYVSDMTAKGKIPDITELSQKAEENDPASQTAQEEKTSSRSKKTLIKGGILGGAAALILMIILLAACYVLGGKLRAEDDISELFGVGSLGLVRDPQKKAKAGIDRKIEQRRLRIRGIKEEAPEIVAANLQIAAANAGTEVLYATGTVFGEKEMGLAEKLGELLREKGIELKTGKPFMSDAAAMEEAGSVGNIIFIENTDSTIRTDLAGKLAFCKENSIRVLGMVVMA